MKTRLVLFSQSLDVGFSVGIEELFAALLPGCFEFWRGDVPVGAAFLADRTQVLAQILLRRPAKEPVAVVNLVNDQIRHTGVKVFKILKVSVARFKTPLHP